MPAIRPARRDDAQALARLIDLAGEGMPSHLWSQAAAPGEDPFAVGAARARRPDGGFSFRHAWVCDTPGDGVVAMLLGYPLAPSTPAAADDVPALVRPLVELEAEAPDSWYVNGLAVLPAHRRRGLGRALLARAAAEARRAGCATLSLIVSSSNAPARQLYAALGFVECARRPIVRFPGAEFAGEWILMTRPAEEPKP